MNTCNMYACVNEVGLAVQGKIISRNDICVGQCRIIYYTALTVTGTQTNYTFCTQLQEIPV